MSSERDEYGRVIPLGFVRSQGRACPVAESQTIELHLEPFPGTRGEVERLSIPAGDCNWEHQNFTYRVVDSPPSHRMVGNTLKPSDMSSELAAVRMDAPVKSGGV
jgi:hypothetical protein